MNHLFYVEHAAHLTKIGMHTKGIYTAQELIDLMQKRHIYCVKPLIAKCKGTGMEVEVRRKSPTPHEKFGKYGMGVECLGVWEE